jgi:hypothetical protein
MPRGNCPVAPQAGRWHHPRMALRVPLPVLLLWGGLFGLLLGAAGGSVLAADDFEKERAYYETWIDRPPLVHRLRGIQRLAQTRDPRALEVLARRYAKPRVPKVEERYLLSVEIGRAFTEARHVEALWDLVRAHKKDEHAWLWRNALGAAARLSDAGPMEEVILDERLSPFLRAAALEALGAAEHPAALPLLERLLAPKLPKAGVARVVLLESCASVLHFARERRDDPVFHTAASRVVDLLARDDVPERTKLVIARLLARIYETDVVTTQHEHWRRILGYEAAPAEAGGTVVGRPRFYGVEAAGSRIAYVLDMSDSMLEPLTRRELEDARLGEKESALPSEETSPNRIAWDKIHSRFDLARAYLKQSIAGLSGDVQFLVVIFGDQARTLKATKGLVPASRGTVKSAQKELDAIEARSATPKRPHGALLGDTNLHTALLRAFRATPRKFLDEEEDVDAAGLLKGCDTFFVFGDGKPTKDDFDAVDRFDGGKVTADRETGETTTRSAGSANYFGPYVRTRYLLDDVRRMNLFRKAEIHTVAIGEADTNLMRAMSREALGHYRSIGMLGRDGKINAWWLMGPFPAPDLASWKNAEAPESAVDLKTRIKIGAQTVAWKRVFTNHKEALIDLNAAFDVKDQVAAYAYADVRVAKAVSARLKLGSDDGVRVWLNGTLIHSVLEKRGYQPDQDSVDIELLAGVNHLLVKVCDDRGPWKLGARLTDRDDRPLSFLMSQDDD